MKPLDTPTVRIVLYEGRGAAPLPDATRVSIFRALLDDGYTVTAAGRHGDTDRVTPGVVASVDGSTLIVLGAFDAGHAPDATDADGRVTLHVHDITGLDAPAVKQRVDATLLDADIEHNRPGRDGKQPAWKPWFPVIDYDRCTNCMQCLSFCLFDVYGVDAANQIQVQHNDNCKTDCPACSRVCPEVAIMFPKYKAGPINGDVVREADVKREAMKVDISDLLGGDIYSRLKKRHEDARERFAKERDEKAALSERMRCLTKMAGEMDIPMSALRSLPSQDEVREKAAAAKAKADAAREANDQ
ncbi:MAG: ferredoxin family protein [Phycisphaera sp.]|nr:ferredoxin family protein [Phycisphaera sp.]